MNRRDFLLSTSSLLLAPKAILAQEQPKPASSDIVFADFESGTYDGWTLTGNCWTPTPPSEATYPGVITGFHGKFYRRQGQVLELIVRTKAKVERLPKSLRYFSYIRAFGGNT